MAKKTWNKKMINILSNFILVIAVLFSTGLIFNIRKRIIDGDTIMPSVVTFILIFISFIVIVLISGISAFHLIWMFFLSLVLGMVLIVFPPTQKLTMSFIILLANSGNRKEID